MFWRGLLLVQTFMGISSKMTKTDNCSCTLCINLGGMGPYSYGSYQLPHSLNVHELRCCYQRQWRAYMILICIPHSFYVFDVLLTKVSEKYNSTKQTSEKPNGQSRMNHPEKLATFDTQYTWLRQTKPKTQYVLDISCCEICLKWLSDMHDQKLFYFKIKLSRYFNLCNVSFVV